MIAQADGTDLDTAGVAEQAALPQTVSDDPLPTVQINGVVWDSVTVGNRVFVTGDFSKARPAGSPVGQNEVTRSNLLAFDINTGVLDTSFNHSLDGEGKAITASPDGKRLYVGGKFTHVDGQTRYRIAAFDLTTNQLVSGFNKGVQSAVVALAASNSTVYAGGNFSLTSDGASHRGLAAFAADGAILNNWKASTNANVAALLLTTDGKRLVIGGSFSQLNGLTYHGLGAVDPATGAALPWASQSASFPIRVDEVPGAGITSLSTDGSAIYLSSYNFHAINDPGGFEGRAALNQRTGKLLWMNDCHGDTYDAIPLNGILYSVGHAHDCQAAKAFPETKPRSYYRALAETTTPSGVNGAGTQGYWNFQGQRRSTQLNWYPNFAAGTYTGISQSGWTVTGNSNYLVIGGEFPSVDGVQQQGIVRFPVRSKAPNKSAPHYYTNGDLKAEAANSNGTAVVSWPTTYDRDDAVLTYSLYRDGTLVDSRQRVSRFWALSTMRFVDSGLQPGSTHRYKLVASDPYGNYSYTFSQPPTGCHVSQGSVNTLCSGESLANTQALFSTDGRFTLRMSNDGDLRLTDETGMVRWHSNTAGREYSTFYLQTDGNLVIRPTRGGYSWTSATAGRGGTYLTLQNDGNLVLRNAAGQAIWNSSAAK